MSLIFQRLELLLLNAFVSAAMVLSIGLAMMAMVTVFALIVTLDILQKLIYLSGGRGMSALDNQVGGDHYKNKAIQPIEYIMANEMDFCEGNVVKYITRWKDKGGVDSLRKIKHYVDFLIEREINGEA